MAQLLVWYQLVFFIPLAAGLMLVLGAAAGLGDGEGPHLDADADADADTDADADADADTDAGGDAGDEAGGHGSGGTHGLLSLLGFGRVPLAVVLTTLCMSFGGTGLVMNIALAPLLRVSPAFVGVSFAVALLAMALGTGAVTRLVARYLPSLETASLRAGGLVGSTGQLLLAADPARAGLVQVLRDGDVYQVQCTASEPLPKGVTVLLTDFDEATRAYAVCRDPLNE